MPAHPDSVDKVVQRYFACVTLERFEYKGVTYEPKPLKVSSGIFTRRMTCVLKCGACCSKFTLDWLPSESEKLESIKFRLSRRLVSFNGRSIEVLSDVQSDNGEYHCRNLNKVNAACDIHPFNPLSCDFEPLRFSQRVDETSPEPNHFTNRPFGRGWQMKRFDGEKGAMCEWRDDLKKDSEWNKEVVRKLRRLQDWSDHFGVRTVIPEVIVWLNSGPHPNSLLVGASVERRSEGFGLT